ncbi:MAG: glycosyltransferase family 2 protein [Caldilinea sp. CFX5]|nr:glycosyltransferase family 2 protein [Caldilinea sp. CFX5]
MTNRELSLISCLCVTENRAAFMPWLLWNFDKQTWPNRELIIVDSSPAPYVVAGRDDVQVISAAPGANVPVKRNLALQAARGEIITWFDDDDWQHPEKLTWLAEALQAGGVYAGTSQGWFVNLADGRVTRYQTPNHQLIFNSAGFRRTAVLPLRFPEAIPKASDSRWLQQIQQRFPTQAVSIPRKAIFFWLCHTKNLSNPATKRVGRQALTTLQQVVAQAWGETDEQLATLRERLAQEEKPLAAQRASAAPRPSPPATPLPKVSACLLSWKRPYNMQPIVDSLRRHDFIDEILVWNNNPEVKLALRGANVRVIQSPQNEICYGRYLCAREAQHNIIYVQDDDVIVGNVPTLLHHFLCDDSRITHALSSQHLRQRQRYIYAQGHHALVGWGAFFQKAWLDRLDAYVARDGCDALLRRGADKIFTILLGRTHNTISAVLQPLRDSTTQGIAMYREPAHQRLNALAVRQALAALRERAAEPVTWNVVITSYNYGRFLRDAVESVLDNDADYVITLVDDGSTDTTEAIGRNYAATFSHIRYLRLPTNRGVSYARNCGVAAVDSRFVVMLDGDDRIGCDYLYEAEKLLRAGCDVANPDAILFGNKQARWVVPERVTVDMLRQRNHVHCAAAFRRTYWTQVGGVAEEMTHWMDYDFWIRLAKAGARIQRVAGDHFYYRKHGNSKSTESAAKRPELMQLIRQRHGAP